MAEQATLRFPPFTIDLAAERLVRDEHPIAVRPKTFAVLRHLVLNAGSLVAKNDLFDAVWGDTVASEELPRISIRELRRALGDDPQAPRFIETVHGRGYRFIAQLSPDDGPTVPTSAVPTPGSDQILVGRDDALASLDRLLERAISGERQIVCVSGEAGIGKTALADTFVRKAAGRSPSILSARGQCVETYGAMDPYLPILDALAQLCRSEQSQRVRDGVCGAPVPWIARELGLLERSEKQATTDTHERVLRVMAETLESLSREVPLLLILEDLHWCDPSTVDLLNVLARRREPARLMVVATLRPASGLDREAPLHAVLRELQAKSLCAHVPLAGLDDDAIGEYLRHGLVGHEDLGQLPAFVSEQTGGNPFFMVALADHLREHPDLDEVIAGRPVFVSVPESLREMIQARLDRLSVDELELLAVASIIGAEFTSHAVASALAESDVERVEDQCEAIVQHGSVLRSAGEIEWPDGSFGARYSFAHALYRQVLYEQQTPNRRRRLHRQVALRLLEGYKERAGEVASALAEHFERGRDIDNAVRFRLQAALRAKERGAAAQTVVHLEAGLAISESLPESRDLAMQQFAMLLELGEAKLAVLGSEMGGVYERMHELARRWEIGPGLFVAEAGLAASHLMAAEYRSAAAAAERLIAGDFGPLPNEEAGGFWLAAIAFNRGRFAEAAERLARVGELLDARRPADFLPADSAMSTGFLQMLRLGHEALAHGIQGHIGQARAFARRTAEIGLEFESHRNRAHALCLEAQFHALVDDVEAVRRLAPSVLSLADEFGLPVLRAEGQFLVAWSEGGEDATETMAHAAAQRVETGWRVGNTHFQALHAEALMRAGRFERALEVTEATLGFAEETGEHRHDADLHRVRAEALAGLSRDGAAAEAAERAVAIAQAQGARLLQLRALTTLARLRPRDRAISRKLRAACSGFETHGPLAAARAAAEVLASRGSAS